MSQERHDKDCKCLLCEAAQRKDDDVKKGKDKGGDGFVKSFHSMSEAEWQAHLDKEFPRSKDTQEWDPVSKSWTKHGNTNIVTPSTWEKCRHPATPAYRFEGVTYHGGSEYLVEDPKADPFQGLVCCLLGKRKRVLEAEGPWASALAQHVPGGNADAISLDWRDYGVPEVRPEFWVALHQEVKRRDIKNVLFYCMGGHGRTGTALASILVMNGTYTGPGATEFVRKHYCKKAVESKSQDEYLAGLATVAAKSKQ